MNIDVRITETDSSPSDLQTLTRDFAVALDRQQGVTAGLPEGVPEAGQRGDWQMIGTILIQLTVSGGVITSLIGLFKSYFDRRPKMELDFQRADGTILKIRAENLNLDEWEQVQRKLEIFLQG